MATDNIFRIASALGSMFGDTLGKALKGSAGAAKRTAKELSNLEKSLVQLERRQRSEKAETESQTSSLARLRNEVSALSKQNDALQKSSAEGWKNFTSTLQGAWAVFSSLTQEAMQFESAMTNMRQYVQFDTPDQFRQMGTDIRELSEELPLATEALLGVYATGAQAGIARDELLAFTEDAARMGVAFATSSDNAGQMMATWRSSMQLSQDEVLILANQVAYLGNTTGASSAKIGEVLQHVGALGTMSGLSGAEIAVLGSTMLSLGHSPKEATAGMKGMLSALTAGSAATEAQKSAFEALGISAETMAIAMQDDAHSALTEMFQALNSISDSARPGILAELFGSGTSESISHLLGNMQLLEESFEGISDSAHYAGSMEEAYAWQSTTTANQLQLMFNTFRNIASTFGEALLPVISELFGALTPFLRDFAEWARENPEAVKNMLLLGGALFALKAGLDLKKAVTGEWSSLLDIWNAMGGMPQIFSMASSIGSTVAGAFGTVAALGPVGIGAVVVAGIAGLIALYNNWDEFAAFWDGVFAWLPEPVQKALSWVYDLLMGFWNWIAGPHEMSVEARAEINAPKFGEAGTFEVDRFENINALATGGIVNRPQLALIGEAGPEAVIPLDRLGEFGGGAITYAPNITISGSADKAMVQGALDEDFERFKRYMERLQREQRRVAFA